MNRAVHRGGEPHGPPPARSAPARPPPGLTRRKTTGKYRPELCSSRTLFLRGPALWNGVNAPPPRRRIPRAARPGRAPDGGGECLPGCGGEAQRALLRVLGVAHGNVAAAGRHFYAVIVPTAVAGLTPGPSGSGFAH